MSSVWDGGLVGGGGEGVGWGEKKEEYIGKKEKERKAEKMKLTRRDLEMCEWINRFGYATADQISKKFQMSKQVVYRRFREMEKEIYVIRERLLFQESGVYRPTSEILSLAGSNLSPIRKVSLATYQHSLGVIDVCLILEQKYSGAEITTERELRAAAGKAGPGQEGHFPDAIMSYMGEKIAIEFEQNPKGRSRLKKIKTMLLRGDIPGVDRIDGVWYIVPQEQKALAQTLAAEFSAHGDYFQVYLYPDFEKVQAAPGVEPVPVMKNWARR